MRAIVHPPLHLLSAAFLGGVLLVGCPAENAPDLKAVVEEKPVAALPASPPPITGLPAQMAVTQRSTTPLPGSGEAMTLTTGDITGGQVEVSLASQEGATILNTSSLKPQESAEFTFKDRHYAVTLKKLDNALVGEDYATFEITEKIAAEEKAAALTEKEKIEQLIAHVAAQKGAVFIRNGAEHPPDEAAEHLRTKWESAGQEMTAREFIDGIASRSSLSGDEYVIRLADGRTRNASEYLNEQLKVLEGGDSEMK